MGWRTGILSLFVSAVLLTSLGGLAACGGSSSATPTSAARATTPTRTVNLIVVTAQPTTAAAEPLSTPTTAPAATGEQTTYEIKDGDTLWSIAQKFNVTVDEIVKANNLTDPNKLQIGQKLIIPKAAQ